MRSNGKRPICRCWTSIAPMRIRERSACVGGSSPRARSPGGRAVTSSSCSSASRASRVGAMSFKYSRSRNKLTAAALTVVLGVLAFGNAGCRQVRGRKQIQEASELYKRGKYAEAVTAFEAAETLVPDIPILWLNKGYTCRQLIAPGGKDAASKQAASCALAAFAKLRVLRPSDRRA